jgi:hypothetical protein
VALLLIASVTAAQGADGGPVGHWPLDEGQGTTAGDASGNGLAGTVSGASWATGVSGTALRFDNGSDGMRVPRSALLEPSQVTVDVWVKAALPPGSWANIISKGSTACTASSYSIYTGGGGGLVFYVSDASRVVSSPSVASTVWNGQWHHVAGTYNGSTVRLYLDGVQVGSGVSSSALVIDYAKTLTNDLILGYPLQSCPGGSDWIGSIDEPRIWPRALSAAEIAALAQFGRVATTTTLELSYDEIDLGEQVTLTARVQPTPTGGTVTFTDKVGGSTKTLGPVAVSATGYASLTTSSLAPGYHTITASFGGSPTYAPSVSSGQSIDVYADTVVDARNVGVSYSRFYPFKDGYRDTLAIRGYLGETATVTIKVLDGAGRSVKAHKLVDRNSGSYSVNWNGRRANGSLLPPGGYRVVQTIVDRGGNTKRVTSRTAISHERLLWRTLRTSLAAAGYSASDRAVDGWVRTSGSRYAGGAIVHGGSALGSFGRAFYRIALPPNIQTFRSIFFCAQGVARKGWRAPYVGLANFSTRQIDWVSIPSDPGSCWGINVTSGHRNYVHSGRIEGAIVSSGFYYMSYDARRVIVRVRYAVLGLGPSSVEEGLEPDESEAVELRAGTVPEQSGAERRALRDARRFDPWSLEVEEGQAPSDAPPEGDGEG